MNIPTELMEMQEQLYTAEELTKQVEMCESGLEEAMKAGSTDMAEYYKEKLAQLREAQVGQGGEIHFGGYHAGLTDKQWREKAVDEYAANGDTRDYRKYKENAAKAANN